jgi:hypothetical protein
VKKQILLDASALKESACFLRVYRILVSGYQEKMTNNDVVYGSAFHKFVAEWITNRENPQPGMKLAKDYFENTPKFVKHKKQWMTTAHLLNTCYEYHAKYSNYDNISALSIDNNPVIEKKFSWPYYVDDDVEVLLCGTTDLLGYMDGIPVFVDHKTTSMWDIEGYFEAFQLSPQMMFYKFCLENFFGKVLPPNPIGDFVRKGLSCVINGVFLGSSKDTQFERSQLYTFSDQQMSDFKYLLDDKVDRLVDLAKNVEDYRMKDGMMHGACETVYGKCKYFGPCTAPDAETEQIILDARFDRRPYNPMMHGE